MKTSKNIQYGNLIRKNSGFTLLEALIGFLILAIGMLGIASLQAISLKAGKTSVYNSVAIMKVDEIFESMRVNSSTAALTAYKVAGTSAGAGADNGCTAGTCTDVQLAQEDVFWWKKNLAAGLPSAATATVNVTDLVLPSLMRTATVTIAWKERDKDSEVAADKSYVASTNICTGNPC